MMGIHIFYYVRINTSPHIKKFTVHFMVLHIWFKCLFNLDYILNTIERV